MELLSYRIVVLIQLYVCFIVDACLADIQHFTVLLTANNTVYAILHRMMIRNGQLELLSIRFHQV